MKGSRSRDWKQDILGHLPVRKLPLPSRFVGVSEWARLAGVSNTSVTKAIRTGRIPRSTCVCTIRKAGSRQLWIDWNASGFQYIAAMDPVYWPRDFDPEAGVYRPIEEGGELPGPAPPPAPVSVSVSVSAPAPPSRDGDAPPDEQPSGSPETASPPSKDSGKAPPPAAKAPKKRRKAKKRKAALATKASTSSAPVSVSVSASTSAPAEGGEEGGEGESAGEKKVRDLASAKLRKEQLNIERIEHDLQVARGEVIPRGEVLSVNREMALELKASLIKMVNQAVPAIQAAGSVVRGRQVLLDHLRKAIGVLDKMEKDGDVKSR